ncbi:MAG: phosphoglycerate mutase family protein [Actinomycetota bacterium]
MSTRLFLIRHANAGARGSDHRDLYRPLTPKGRQRADELVGLLTEMAVRRVVSSPASRCVQTVDPLATALAIEVEEHPDLWEGTPIDHVLALMDDCRSTTTVVCSHGDVIPAVIERLGDRGVLVQGRGCETGSVWMLDHDGSDWTRATYVDPSRAALPAI